MTVDLADLRRSCFVIMPFGRKAVGSRTIDFDRLYDAVFRRAAKIRLSDAKYLRAYRADRQPVPGIAYTRMLLALANARIALADVTGGNTNVHYELGFRHGVRNSGVAIVCEKGTQVPFNIRGLVRVEYEYRPRAEAYNRKLVGKIRQFLRNLLASTSYHPGLGTATETLSARMGTDEAPSRLGKLVSGAERSLIEHDLQTAIASYEEAARLLPSNLFLHQRLGLLYGTSSEYANAIAHFEKARTISDKYPDAHRGAGLAQRELWMERGCPPGTVTGEEALRRALRFDPADAEIAASLGDVLQREGRYDEGRQILERASKSSLSPPIIRERLREVEHLANDGVLVELEPFKKSRGQLRSRIEISNLPLTRHGKDELKSVLESKGVKVERLKTKRTKSMEKAEGLLRSVDTRALSRLLKLDGTELLGKRFRLKKSLGGTDLTGLLGATLGDNA